MRSGSAAPGSSSRCSRTARRRTSPAWRGSSCRSASSASTRRARRRRCWSPCMRSERRSRWPRKPQKAAAPKAEYPKPLVRVKRGAGGYESEVRTVADADGETAAKAAGFQVVEVAEPGADFVEYPKMLYHDPDARPTHRAVRRGGGGGERRRLRRTAAGGGGGGGRGTERRLPLRAGATADPRGSGSRSELRPDDARDGTAAGHHRQPEADRRGRRPRGADRRRADRTASRG